MRKMQTTRSPRVAGLILSATFASSVLFSQDSVPERALHGFGAWVRHMYVSRRFGDKANTVAVPSYTLFDAALRYDLGALSPT